MLRGDSFSKTPQNTPQPQFTVNTAHFNNNNCQTCFWKKHSETLLIKIKELHQDYNRLQQENKILQSQLKKLQQENNILQSQSQETSLQRDLYKMQLEHIWQQHKRLQEICELAAQELLTLRQENEKLKFQKQELQEKLNAKILRTYNIKPKKNENAKEDKATYPKIQQLTLFELPNQVAKDSPEKPSKGGAPPNHIGVSRTIPKIIDNEIIVPPPTQCPYCKCKELYASNHQETHVQQEIKINVETTRYIHKCAYCPSCKKMVSSYSENELPRSRLGPTAKAFAVYLRSMGFPYRKIMRVFKDAFGLDITHSTLIKFGDEIAQKAEPIYNEMIQTIRTSKSANVDETSWPFNGNLRWLWVYITTIPKIVLYSIDKSRSSDNPVKMLGPKYDGILCSDFYSAYNVIQATAKQKCLAHVIRDIEDLEQKFIKMPPSLKDDKSLKFLQSTKILFKQAINIHKEWKGELHSKDGWLSLKKWFLEKMQGLLSEELSFGDAENLRERLLKYIEELFTFLEHPYIDPTNNIAERALRTPVISRKISFGNKSEKGAKNFAIIMSIIQTGILNNKNPFEVILSLYKNKVTRLGELLEQADTHSSNDEIQLLLPFYNKGAPPHNICGPPS